MSTPHPQAYQFFLKWYTTPPDERIPKLADDFYQQVGIDANTVAEYQSRDSYYDDLYNEARNWGRSKIPELLHSLYKEFMLTKKPAILETYKKLLEVDKKEGGNTIIFNALTPTDKQYRQILERETRLLKNVGDESPVELLPAN